MRQINECIFISQYEKDMQNNGCYDGNIDDSFFFIM